MEAPLTEVDPRPLPARDGLSPYWTSAAEGRLVIQRCQACGNFQHPPAPVCYQCLGDQLSWQEVSPTGVIHSLSRLCQARVRGFELALPLTVAVTGLDVQEGVFIVGNLFGVDGEAARIGDRVDVWFESVDATLSLPQFRLRTGEQTGERSTEDGAMA